MGGFYEDLRDNTVDQLLKQFGKSMTLQIPTGSGEHDPVSGLTSTTYTSVTVRGCILSPKKNRLGGAQGRSLVGAETSATPQVEKRKALLSAKTITAEVGIGCRLVDGGTLWIVSEAEAVAPAGIAVVWKLVVHK